MNSTFNNSAARNGTSAGQPASEVVVPWFNICFSVICGFGMLTNFINILVFSNSKLKDKVYTCMLVSCISEFFYLAINGLTTLIQCGAACAKYVATLPGQIMSVYFINYLSTVLAFFCILIEIFLAFQRYTILINRPFLVNTRLSIILPILFTVAALIHSPALMNSVIILSDPITQTYSATQTVIGKSSVGKTLRTISSWTRIVLTLFVLTGLSIFTAFKSRAYFRRKNRLKVSSKANYSNKNVSNASNSGMISAAILNRSRGIRSKEEKYASNNREQRGSRRITLLVIMISLLYSFGNVPYAMQSLLSSVTSLNSSILYITIAILYTYKSLTIVLFYFFNSNYRQVLRDYIKKIY